MKIWKDASGRWIDAAEFRQRFVAGVQKVTLLQQLKTQLLFSWITVLGILCGIIVSIWQIKTLWWLGIILVAGLGNTIVGMIGLYQRYKHLKNIQEKIADEHKAYADKVQIVDEGIWAIDNSETDNTKAKKKEVKLNGF